MLQKCCAKKLSNTMWNFPKLRKIGILTMLQNVARTIVQNFLKITQNWDFDNVAKCCAKKLSKTMRNFSKLRKIGISIMELLRPVLQCRRIIEKLKNPL